MIGAIAAAGATLRPVAPRAPVAPSWTVNPSLLSGAIESGNTTCSPGTFDGTQPITPSFQWRESATEGGTYADMAGATSATFVNWTNSATPWKRCRVTLTGPTGLTASFDTAAAQVTAAAPPGSLIYTVQWDAPLTDEDNTDVATLTGFKVYWGQDPLARETAANSATVGAGVTQYTITGLEAGTYYAWVAAISAAGESEVGPRVEFVPA